MKQLKKNLLLLAVAVSLVLVGANTAFAQVQFQASGNVRKIRLEGTTEAVGAVTLAAISNGTILANSTIDFDFGTEVVVAGTITCSAVNGAVPPASDCNGAGDEYTVTLDGNVLTMTFIENVVFAVGNTIEIVGSRVNANAFGVGTIDVDLSAVVPASVPPRPITFFIVTSVPVATVQPKATSVDFDAGDALLTCTESDSEFTITITENFNQALTSADDEEGFGPTPDSWVDSVLEVTIRDVPEDVTITLNSFELTGGLDVTEDPETGESQTAGAGGEDLVWTIEINASATTGANEEIELSFTAEADGLEPGVAAIEANVTLTGGDFEDDGEVPEFVDPENDQGTDDVFSLADCVTDLLFPWVTNQQGFITGLTFANTTADAFPDFGASPQGGACVVNGWKAADGTRVGPVTSPIVDTGETLAFLLGSSSGVFPNTAFANFSGYLIAECGFQNAHGFAFMITDFSGTGLLANVAQGYLALVIPTPSAGSPRDPGGVGESLGE